MFGIPRFFVFDNNWHWNTCVAPAVVNEDVEFTLRVDFDHPMRSIVAFVSGGWNPDEYANLRVLYRAEGREWTELEEVGRGSLTQAIQVATAPEGSTFFELQAILRMRQKTYTWSRIEFLQAYFGPTREGHDHRSAPFILIADPDPDVAILPK